MKITVTNTNSERQAASVTIDTKGLNYPYAIREAIELALRLDGYQEDTIREVFNRYPDACKPPAALEKVGIESNTVLKTPDPQEFLTEQPDVLLPRKSLDKLIDSGFDNNVHEFITGLRATSESDTLEDLNQQLSMGNIDLATFIKLLSLGNNGSLRYNIV